MSGENKNQNTMRNRQGQRGPGGPGDRAATLVLP